MIHLDLIEFADLVKPIDIVNQILKQNSWIDGPIPLEEISRAAGIKDIQYAPLNSFEGTLIANEAKTEGVIVINNNARNHRQRFTLGHELGHFMIPHHGNKMNCSKTDLAAKPTEHMNSNYAIEVEANQFAAEILIPRILLNKHSAFNKEPSIESIKTISKDFEVSFQVGALRFAALHSHPIAFVMSKMGKVLFAYKNNDFPFWLKVGKQGDLVPPKSLSGIIDCSYPETIVCDECLSSLWFNTSKYYLLPENLIEEVYVQEDGYIATILWFDEEIEEQE